MTTKNVPLPSEILDHAAELIEIWGHAKRRYVDTQTGAMCEAGAVEAATGYQKHTWNFQSHGWETNFSSADAWPNYNLVYSYMSRVRGGASHNDLVATTKKDAIAKIREAADLARSENQ